MAKEITVVEDIEKPVPAEVMAQAIVDIGAAMKRISKSGLTRKALIVLISHSSNQYQRIVESVLNAMDSLEKTYLVPKGKVK